uniref:Uncharacterized protein n=1 Tax=Cyprinus carpio TaxID=7962 RepID=A0A8C1MBJ7_CYPCA
LPSNLIGVPNKVASECYHNKFYPDLEIFRSMATDLSLQIYLSFRSFVATARVDFKQKYASVFAEFTVSDYHVNAQTASGETAFKNMTVPYMISPCLPMTFIYGSRSRIDGQSGRDIQEMRPNSHTEITVSLYVFADQSEDFNQAVLKICNNIRHIINGEAYNQ